MHNKFKRVIKLSCHKHSLLLSAAVLLTTLLSACQIQLVQPSHDSGGGMIGGGEIMVSEETQANIDAAVEQIMGNSTLPGVAIAVVSPDVVLYEKGYGVADAEMQAPITPDSLFYLYSNTKPFTAMAILQLVEQGKIDLDQPAVSYLPSFRMADERYADITVRDLLAHRTGISVPGLPPTEPLVRIWESIPVDTSDAALDIEVASIADFELTMEPGTDFAYGNINYNILARIVAEVSGERFTEYIDNHILSPLNMDSATFTLDEVDEARKVYPHVLNEAGEPVHSPIFPYNLRSLGSSGLFGSLNDLTTWTMLHLNRGTLDGEQLLSAEGYDAWWSPQVATNWPVNGSFGVEYGLGWFLGELNGQPTVAHGGNGLGFSNYMLVVPEENVAVIALTNRLDHYIEDDFYGLVLAKSVMEEVLR